MGITIENLNPSSLPSRDHFIAAMKDGLTVKLSIGQILDLFVNGAPEALDTWLELVEKLEDDDDALAAIVTDLTKRVRVDAAQAFNATEKAQGRANLDMSWADAAAKAAFRANLDMSWVDAAAKAAFRANIDAQQNLGWKPLPNGLVDVSTPQTEFIFAMPAGAKALRLTGQLKLSTTTDSVTMRISVNGGSSYYSASGDYTQGGQFTAGTAVTATAFAAATAFTLAAASGDPSFATQFSAQLDSAGGNILPMFTAENNYATGFRKTFGHSPATGLAVTHVRIIPTGTATFVAGTRFLVEAF